MDNTAWLRQTLLGTTIIGATGQSYTIVDVTEDGIVVQGDAADRRWLLTVSEIVMTAQLWAQLGRTPSLTELLPVSVDAEHAPYPAPLVRVLRSVPQIRTWTARSAAQVDLFMLDLADAAD